MNLNIFAFIFGAAIGSFLNVCIFRIPDHESIVKPLSQCPHCHQPIRFYDNIPMISFLVLRARCRDCGGKISWRYPLVELITALLALLLFMKFGLTLNFLVFFIFTAVLITISFIDLDHQIIPDILSLPGIPIFFLAAIFIVRLPWQEALIGLLIGGGMLFLIAFVYEFITKREGMGGGDIKLLAMIGGFLGWKSLIFVLLFSSLAGAVVGITVMIIKKQDMKYAVPFGPFLSLAAVAYIFWGEIFMRFLIFRY
ncbi:MAG: leader peptidase (prepilin peptidase) / N-methyltransferase [Syntrophaceae bacterium]|nr:MAG: leader peptidase (prepilin peptidase) / N-methyltransferase [Syntrophaceae bacterium]